MIRKNANADHGDGDATDQLQDKAVAQGRAILPSTPWSGCRTSQQGDCKNWAIQRVKGVISWEP